MCKHACGGEGAGKWLYKFLLIPVKRSPFNIQKFVPFGSNINFNSVTSGSSQLYKSISR
jgi:hypothetical protein